MSKNIVQKMEYQYGFIATVERFPAFTFIVSRD